MDGRKTEITYFLPEEIPAALNREISRSSGSMIIHEDRIFLKHNGMILSLPDTKEGSELASHILAFVPEYQAVPRNAADLFKRLLSGSQVSGDPGLYRRFNINPAASRCVVVFRMPLNKGEDMASLFAGIAPVENNDYIIPVDYHTVALVKDLESQSVSETVEFSRAIIGTMEEEGISGIKAGVGGCVSSAAELKDSYSGALNALYLGEKYHIHDTVFCYEEQLLERIVDSIPPERKREIMHSFCRNPQTRLPEEMMETVRVFFQNDLNLTAASRQLFIHRNTLNYRLDKIKRDYGLDLRRFRDAVVFSIVSMILENNDEPDPVLQPKGVTFNVEK